MRRLESYIFILLSFLLISTANAQIKKYKPPQYQCKGPTCDPSQQKIPRKKRRTYTKPFMDEPPKPVHRKNTNTQTYVISPKKIKHRTRFLSAGTGSPKAYSYKKLNRLKRKNSRKIQRRNFRSARGPRNYTMKHYSRDKIRYPTYSTRHKKGNLDKKHYSSVSTTHHKKNLDRKHYSGREIAHRKNLDKKSYANYNIKHKGNLDKKSYANYGIKHKGNLDKKYYANYGIKHKGNLDKKYYANYGIKHKGNLENVCYARFQVTHRKPLDDVCYAQYRIKHGKPLEKVCYPVYPVKHKGNLDNVCLDLIPKVVHKDFEKFPCYPQYEVKHKNFEKFTCYQYEICHTPLKNYKVYCDPNKVPETTDLERFADKVKYLATNHRKFCKLNNLYSSVSAGMIVRTEKYGDVMVVDYKIKKFRKIYRTLKDPSDSTKYKKIRKKHKTIGNLVVLVLNPKKPYKRTGNINFKEVKLSEAETKRILIENFVKRGRFDDLARVYPEERKNIELIKERYGYKRKYPPGFYIPDYSSE